MTRNCKSVPIVRLGDHVSKIQTGITPCDSAAYRKNGIALIRTENVHMNSFDPNRLVFVSEEQAMKDSLVQAGDILLNVAGTSLGCACMVPDGLSSANVSQNVCVIRVTKELEPAFITYYISTPEFQRKIKANRSGVRRQVLTKKMIEDFEIPFLSITEQRRIAKIM